MWLPARCQSRIIKFTLSGSFEERLSTVGNVDSEIKLMEWSSVINVRKATTSGAFQNLLMMFLWGGGCANITRHLERGVRVREFTKLPQQELINNLGGGEREICRLW